MRVQWLDMGLALVFGALVVVYVLQSSQAEDTLRLAVAKRDETAKLLEATQAALVTERRKQADDMANLTATLTGSSRRAAEQSLRNTRRHTTTATTTKATTKATLTPPSNAPPLASTWSDFPCALREFKVAKVTKTCEVACRDSRCDRARQLCERLVECDAATVDGKVLDEALTTGSLASKTARLVRNVDAARRRDSSAVELSKWWRSPAMADRERPRTYLVVSYGGCGSKMLAGWLSSLEKKRYVDRVYHLHDSKPPAHLRELPPPRAPPSTQRDFRARRFPGGGRFRDDTPLVKDVDKYRVLFIFKDPAEALVSRYGYGHCLHLGGDCGNDERAFPKLDVYATRGVDAMGILPFFANYARADPENRSFPIVLLNYHKLWDNLDALMLALGLPTHLKSSFPERTETVRNDLTAHAEHNNAHSEKTRSGLDAIYKPILDHIRAMPAVTVV